MKDKNGRNKAKKALTRNETLNHCPIGQAWRYMLASPVLRKLRLEDCYKSNTSTCYTVTSRQDRATVATLCQ